MAKYSTFRRLKVGNMTKDGQLPAFAWPGGYPMFYLDRDNSTLCAKCASESDSPDQLESFRPVASGIHWEGEPIQCEQCNCAIESAYGVPEGE